MEPRRRKPCCLGVNEEIRENRERILSLRIISLAAQTTDVRPMGLSLLTNVVSGVCATGVTMV